MAYRQARSKMLFAEAVKHIPGGVDSPVRAFGAVGGACPFIVRGKGSRIWDEDGNEYIDTVCSWGPLIHGHAPSEVVAAIKKAAELGTSFGASTRAEVELAKLIKKAFRSIDLIRFVNSGTEATMSALRLARGYTGRDKIVKFIGCYHGHADGLLVKAGSGALTLGVPSSPGVPAAYARQTLLAQYNDLDSVKRIFKKHKGEIAAVIVEPVAGNMGVIPPADGFLEGLRKLTKRYGAILIFDEIITGFRVALGGAQELYKIKPDLTCLGKIIGGGLPVGAYGGRKDIMEKISPLGGVYQAGTLSGNPLAMAAGLATLKMLFRKGIYKELNEKSTALEKGIREAAQSAGQSLRINRVGSMQTWFFTDKEVSDYKSATASDTKKFAKFFNAMLRRGVYLPPSQFEAIFVSTAHTKKDIDFIVSAEKEAFDEIKN
ncbi:MAG: glutamate-1-semialdehyde 2,1-aminomutase [bacterium]